MIKRSDFEEQLLADMRSIKNSPPPDIVDILIEIAERRQILENVWIYHAAAREITYLRAKIDALMLEYCPGEMTKEQLDTWGKHQEPSHE